MEPGARTRLASVGVLFLVFVTGFLLGMAWDRTDGALEAGEADEQETAVARADAADPEIESREDARDGPEDRDDRGDGEGLDARDDDAREGGDDRDRRDRDRDRDRDDRRLIVHRVGITDGQEARVDSIVDLHGERVRALRREMEEEYDPRFRSLRREMEAEYDPRFQEVLLRTRRSIRSVLTEDQAVRYDSLLAEHDRKEAEKKRRRR